MPLDQCRPRRVRSSAEHGRRGWRRRPAWDWHHLLADRKAGLGAGGRRKGPAIQFIERRCLPRDIIGNCNGDRSFKAIEIKKV